MRKLLFVLLLVGGLASRAEAVTLRDLVDLSRQGMSDDLLIALVEAEKSVFHLNAADVKQLKEQGLTDRLLIHLLQTPTLRPAPEPALHVADARPSAPAVASPAVIVVDRVETVAVPVYVPVPTPSRHRRDRDRDHDGRVDDEDRKPREPAKPVYWGYGGKLRPGSWKDR